MVQHKLIYLAPEADDCRLEAALMLCLSQNEDLTYDGDEIEF